MTHNFHRGPRGKVKPKIDKGNAPVKHSQSLKSISGSGTQHSEHSAKDQSKIMRYVKR